MSDDARLLIAISLVTSAAIAALIFGAMGLSRQTCLSQARAMNLVAEWGGFQGCIVEYKGERIPIGAVGMRTIVEQKP